MATDRLDALLEMAEQDGLDAFTSYAIAIEYAKQEEFEMADEWFEKTLNLDPDYPAAYHQWALMLAGTGEIDRAEDLIRRGMEAADRVGDLHAKEEMEAALEELV